MQRTAGCQWGLPVFVYLGTAISTYEPVAFPHAAEKHREICTSLTFEIAAGLLASDSRISIRAARDAPGSSL
jgi:hypothetical protein